MRNPILYLLIFGFGIIVPFTAKSQSPYNVKWQIDLPIFLAGAGGAALGFKLIGEKGPSDSATIADIRANVDDIAKWNRGAIHPYNDKWDTRSNYLFYGSFPAGFLLFFDDEISKDFWSIALMYMQAQALNGASYALTASQVVKYRPYAYDSLTSFPKAMATGSKSSFYGGHPTVTATATSFMFNVYSKYHPDSPFRWVILGVGGAATLANAYSRYKGGFHFTSDLLIGLAVGTSIGYLVPKLHERRSDGGVSINPFVYDEYKGLSLNYTIK